MVLFIRREKASDTNKVDIYYIYVFTHLAS